MENEIMNKIDEGMVMDETFEVEVCENQGLSAIAIAGIAAACAGAGYGLYRLGKWVKAKYDERKAMKEQAEAENNTVVINYDEMSRSK